MTLLLESCNKLARLEFERVGALRDMKRNMATRRNVLHKMIVQVPHQSEVSPSVHALLCTCRPPSPLSTVHCGAAGMAHHMRQQFQWSS